MISPLIYLKHVREEFTHIVWPTSRTAVAHSLIVIVIAIIITLIVGFFDYFFSSVVNRLIG